MKNHAELARDNFLKGYNCAQAVAIAFSEEMGMGEEQLAKLASSFGGGFGKMREVCGAVSGAMLVYGALRGNSDPEDPVAKKEHYANVRAFADRFKAEHETIICRELLHNIGLKKESGGDPEDRTPEYYRTRPGVRFVETAATILEQMLAE